LVLNELQEIQFIVKISLEYSILEGIIALPDNVQPRSSYKKLKMKKSKEGQGEE